jgi:hypothetical protein
VLECRGPGGDPPYLVRWDPDGHTALFFPQGTASVARLSAEDRAAGAVLG